MFIFSILNNLLILWFGHFLWFLTFFSFLTKTIADSSRSQWDPYWRSFLVIFGDLLWRIFVYFEYIYFLSRVSLFYDILQINHEFGTSLFCPVFDVKFVVTTFLMGDQILLKWSFRGSFECKGRGQAPILRSVFGDFLVIYCDEFLCILNTSLFCPRFLCFMIFCKLIVNLAHRFSVLCLTPNLCWLSFWWGTKFC